MEYPDLTSFLKWSLSTLCNPFTIDDWDLCPMANFRYKCYGSYTDKNGKTKNLIVYLRFRYLDENDYWDVKFNSNQYHFDKDKKQIIERLARLPNPWSILQAKVNSKRLD